MIKIWNYEMLKVQWCDSYMIVLVVGYFGLNNPIYPNANHIRYIGQPVVVFCMFIILLDCIFVSVFGNGINN